MGDLMVRWSNYDMSPSPDAVAMRYADRSRSTAPSGVDASVASLGAKEELLDDTRLDGPLARAAKFVLQDMGAYRDRIVRALNEGDTDAVAGYASEIDRFAQENEYDLRGYMGAFSRGGPEGVKLAQDISSVLTGSYKNEWGAVDPRSGALVSTVQSALDDTSEDSKVRRASSLAREIGVSDAVALAMTDRNDMFYPVLGRYGEALTAKALTPAGQQDLDGARKALIANAKAAVPFAQKYLARFGDVDDRQTAQDMGTFLSEFDRIFNTKNTVSGSRMLEDVADAYLSARDRGETSDMSGYISRLAEMRDGIVAGLSGAYDSKGQARARVHEANSILGAFIRDSMSLSGGVPADSSLYSAALVSSAKKVAMLTDTYGIDLRNGAGGLSRRISQMALRSLGVEGADDGGVSDFMDTLMPAIDRYVGSDGPPVTLRAKNGQETVQPVPGSFGALEGAIRTSAGRALWRMWKESGGGADGAGGAGALLSRIESDPRWQEELKNAVAAPLRAMFTDAGVADEVAERVFKNPVSGQPVTVIRALQDLAGKLDEQGKPIIPDEARIGPGVGPDGRSPDPAVYDKILAAPDAVIPMAKGDDGLRTTLTDYATKAVKALAPGHTDSDVYRKAQALGDLIGQSVGRDVSLDPGAQMARRAVILSTGGTTDKTFGKSSAVASDLATMAENAAKGDADAMLSVALIASTVTELPDTTKALLKQMMKAMSMRGVSSGLPFAAELFEATGTARAAGRADWALAARFLNWVGKKTGLKYALSEPLDPATKNMVSALQALEKLGVDISDRGKILGHVVTRLKASGEFADTVLVRSGYMDADGNVSENRLLQTLQERQAADPRTESPLQEPTDGQRRARKVLSALMGPDTLVGRFNVQYIGKLKGLGYTDEEAVQEAGRASQLVRSAADRGTMEGLRQHDALMSRSQRFFPRIQRGQDGRAYVMADDVSPAETAMMTDEEYQVRRDMFTKEARDVYGLEVTPAMLDHAQVIGPRRWAEQRAVGQKFALARASAEARESVKDRDE